MFVNVRISGNGCKCSCNDCCHPSHLHFQRLFTEHTLRIAFSNASLSTTNLPINVFFVQTDNNCVFHDCRQFTTHKPLDFESPVRQKEEKQTHCRAKRILIVNSLDESKIRIQMAIGHAKMRWWEGNYGIKFMFQLTLSWTSWPQQKQALLRIEHTIAVINHFDEASN